MQMKSKKLLLVLMLSALSLLAGCGGSGGGDEGGSSTGTVSMSITDAKPLLPVENIDHFFIWIEEVLVHKSGSGWVTLPLPKRPNPEEPYQIDLWQFYGGNTTELVPPVPLEKGKYTQVRLVVSSALLVINGTSYEVSIPSESLKTDQNFEFDVDKKAVDITIDFDLSKSLVLEGAPGSESYKLKPVLHIVMTENAATIEGTISEGIADKQKFRDDYVVITVFTQIDSEEYTKLRVDLNKDDTGKKIETKYSIFWLVPDQSYRVEIDYDPATNSFPGFDTGSKIVDPNDFIIQLDETKVATVDFP